MNTNAHHVKPVQILYSVIALALVIWVILFYQVSQIKPPEEAIPTPPPETGLSDADRIQLQTALDTAYPPPKKLTPAQMSALASELDKKFPTKK